MNIHVWSTLSVSKLWVILHVGHSIISIFNDSFNIKCDVRSPSIKNTAIPDETIACAVSFRDRMVAEISEIRKDLPTSPMKLFQQNRYVHNFLSVH